MATISEENVGTTILMLQTAAGMKGAFPLRVDLVLPENRPGVWRQLALEYLEKREAFKAKAETLHLNPSAAHEASPLS